MRTLTFDSEKFRLKGLLCNVNKENWSSLLLISSAPLNKPVQSLIEIYCYEQRIARPLEYAFPPLTIRRLPVLKLSKSEFMLLPWSH